MNLHYSQIEHKYILCVKKLLLTDGSAHEAFV